MTKAVHNVICCYHYYMLSPLCSAFTVIYKKQTVFLRYIVLQFVCSVMVHVTLIPTLNVLNFCLSIFRSDRIPVGTRISARPDRSWGPPSLPKNGYRVFPEGEVRPERAAEHSLPSSAAVMEGQSYTSTHPLGYSGPVTGSLYLLLSAVCVQCPVWLFHVVSVAHDFLVCCSCIF